MDRRNLNGKGRSAAAGSFRVRISNNELRSLQIFLVIDLGAHQVLHAHGIDQKRDVLIFDLTVSVLNAFIECEALWAAASVKMTLGGGGGADVPVVSADFIFDFPACRGRLCFVGQGH